MDDETQKLILSYRGLAISFAKRYAKQFHFDLEELISEAELLLVAAVTDAINNVERFNKASLKHYVCFRIEKRLLQFVLGEIYLIQERENGKRKYKQIKHFIALHARSKDVTILEYVFRNLSKKDPEPDFISWDDFLEIVKPKGIENDLIKLRVEGLNDREIGLKLGFKEYSVYNMRQNLKKRYNKRKSL